MKVGWLKISAKVKSDGVARTLVLPSSTIRFWLIEVRRSFMCKVKIIQMDWYPVRILFRFLLVVPSSGGSASG